jgi:hypothetical protein
MPTRNGAEDVLLSNIARRQVLEALAPQHQASVAVAAEDDRRTRNARREGALAQQARTGVLKAAMTGRQGKPWLPRALIVGGARRS